MKKIITNIIVILILFSSFSTFALTDKEKPKNLRKDLDIIIESNKNINEKISFPLQSLLFDEKKSPVKFKSEIMNENQNNNNNKMRVEVLLSDIHFLDSLENFNDQITVENHYRSLAQIKIPKELILPLSEMNYVNYIHTPVNPELYDVISEGVSVIGANLVQNKGINGEGVKVAVIDAGFKNYDTNPDLPSSRIKELTSFRADNDIEAGVTHGCACAEIILDVAPMCDLYLYNFGTISELNDAVIHSISKGIDIISFSIGYIGINDYDGIGYDVMGDVCSIVDNARDNDILFIVSAGNEAQEHYNGYFHDDDNDNWHEFDPPYETIIMDHVNAGEIVDIRLTWDDWPNSDQDFNLYLIDSYDNIVAESKNIQSGSQPPFEWIYAQSVYGGDYQIAIRRYSASRNVHFELYGDHDFLTSNVPQSSLSCPSDAFGSTTVGATYWQDDSLESFSSRGPTNDGRTKPDLSAPDGVSTYAYGGGNFYGTSASAPHTAGAAALLMSNGPLCTADDVENILENNALDLGESGKDNSYGSGRINVWDAYQSMQPIASFNYSPLNPTTQDLIQFTDTSSDSDGFIDSWSWDFGDGNTSTIQYPVHQYDDDGIYNVTLSITDDHGISDKITQQIIISNSPPIANYNYSPSYPDTDDIIQFTDISYDLDGTIDSWYWDFGDGNISINQNPTHQYTNQGNYSISLAITDDSGSTDEVIKNISVEYSYGDPRSIRGYVIVDDNLRTPDDVIAHVNDRRYHASIPGDNLTGFYSLILEAYAGDIVSFDVVIDTYKYENVTTLMIDENALYRNVNLSIDTSMPRTIRGYVFYGPDLFQPEQVIAHIDGETYNAFVSEEITGFYALDFIAKLDDFVVIDVVIDGHLYSNVTSFFINQSGVYRYNLTINRNNSLGDTIDDVLHQTTIPNDPWLFDDKPYLDVINISYSASLEKVNLSMKVNDTIRNSSEIIYYLYLNTSDSMYIVYWMNGTGFGIGSSTINESLHDLSPELNFTGDSFYAKFDVLGTFVNISEFWGYSQEYYYIPDNDFFEYWSDWIPNSSGPDYYINPTIEITKPENNSNIYNETINVKGNATDYNGIENISIYWIGNSTPYDDDDGDSSPLPPSGGGNTSGGNSTGDEDPPGPPSGGGPAINILIDSISIDDPVIENEFNFSIPLMEGWNNFKVVARDSYGNNGSRKWNINYTIDTPPEIQIIPIEESMIAKNETVNITYEVSDDFSVSKCVLNINGPEEYNDSVYSSGAGTQYCDQSYSNPGTYSFYIWAKDNHGHENTSDVNHFWVCEHISTEIINSTGHQNISWEHINLSINFTNSTSIRFIQFAENPYPEKTPLNTLKTYFDISIENDSQDIHFPVNITMFYTEEDLNMSGISEDKLIGLYFWNQTLNEWILYGETGVNTKYNQSGYEGYIWANVNHFTSLVPGGDSQPPTQVIGVSISDAKDGKLTIKWDGASDNIAIDFYRIYRDGLLIDNTSKTSYTDTGLNNGQTYSYQISAVDTSGNEGPLSDSKSGKPTKTEEENNIPTDGGFGGGFVSLGSTNAPPVADVSAGEPYTGFINEQIIFDGSASTDSDGNITEWYWIFDDGKNASGETVTYVFTEAKQYVVTLKVTDDGGLTDTAETIVSIRQPNNPPSIPTMIGPTAGSVENKYSYSLVSSDKDNDTIRYSVIWGDGFTNTTNYTTNNTMVNLSHSWSTPGIYEIEIYAEDEYNATSTSNIILMKIDVIVEFIDKEIKGYLLDDDMDGVFDIFHNNKTSTDTATEKKDDERYLLDSNDNGEWDYEYSMSIGLQDYEETTDDTKKDVDGLPWMFIIIGIVVLVIVVLIILFKTGLLYLDKKD